MYLKFAFLVLATSLFSVVSAMPFQNDPTDLLLEISLLKDSNPQAGNYYNYVATHRRPEGPRRNRRPEHPRPSIQNSPLRIEFRQTNAKLPILPPNPAYSTREIVETYVHAAKVQAGRVPAGAIWDRQTRLNTEYPPYSGEGIVDDLRFDSDSDDSQ
ncbi:hypothetical protein DFH05DRAFT_1455450 [Lentinula detonsa]|uniref:Uncharacterized protein n=1 Tax=Lentinula detonsa TaxID=2804962 RepID=A0A9W8U2T8_9AGAR|nr:hypothetical protein DFH05DRAFT_1455450 [Lentinula detonsa]